MGCCDNDNSLGISAIVGPPGPTGATGAQGPQGDPGPQGEPGTSSVRKYVAQFDNMVEDTTYTILAQSLIDCGLLMPCCPDLVTSDPIYATASVVDFVWRLYYLDSGTGFWKNADNFLNYIYINKNTGDITFTTPLGWQAGTYRFVIIG